MAGTFLGKYDTTAANNAATGTGSVSVAEGMLPSNINNAFRDIMADIRQHYNTAEWIEYGDGAGTYTATYASSTSFTIDGANVTAIYHAGRRIKLTAATPGTIYGTVSSTSFSTNTTVNVTWDSGSLSSEAITSVYIGVLAKTNNSIPTEVIGTTNIADDAITVAKMAVNSIDSDQYVDGSIDLAHMSVNSIDSDQYVDASIDAEHLAADIITGAKIADDAIDSEHYTDGSIDTAHIAADQITSAKIADDQIDSEHYVDGSIDLAHLAADSVNGSKIVDDAIDSEHYTDGSIDTAHIADLNVTLAKLAASSVNSSKIVDDSIVNADINSSAAIAATKIHDGSISNTEFGYLNGVSSAIQTQIDTKAATTYVNDAVAGLRTRIICRAATTANITLSSDLQNGDTLDGVTLATGNRVLVKNQSTDSQNGIYTVVSSGTAGRDSQFDAIGELAGQMVIIQEGSSNADKFFLCTTDTDATLGSDSITFTLVTPQNVGDVTLTGTQTLTNKTLTAPVINSPTGDFIKIEGTNFTDSLLVGHATTGTLNSATDNTGVGIGALDALTSGVKNTAIGQDAGTVITTGSHNTFIGNDAGLQATDMQGCVAIGSGALGAADPGNNNIAIGESAGKLITGARNLCIGENAGDNITSGSGNVIIGSAVDPSSATGNRQLIIAGFDGSTTTTWISGDSNGVVTVNGGTVATAGDVTSLAIALG